MEIKIRKAKLDDVPNIQKIYYRLLKYEDQNFSKIIDPRWIKSEAGKRSLFKRIKDPKQHVVLAVDEDKPVGFLIGEYYKATAYKRIKLDSEVLSLFVEEKYRNNKIGPMLLDEFERWARVKKCDQIKLEPYYNNEKAIKFYKREGYKDYVVMLKKKL
ncbi:GNAT family N-acetyltransferase [Patescibacteria group bacterium]